MQDAHRAKSDPCDVPELFLLLKRCSLSETVAGMGQGGMELAVRSFGLLSAVVIPVVTFLTPLAEHFSDLKDR